jgi:hypothetical protein
VKNLLVVLLLAALPGAGRGRLHVHTAPGLEVIVDGVSAGITTFDSDGKMVDVVPGRHHVVVRARDGREGAFDVTIVEAQTADVTISALGLRKKKSVEMETGSVSVVCVPSDCSALFAGRERLGPEDVLDGVPPGHYDVVVARGSKTLRSEVDVAAGTILTVDANFTTGIIRSQARRRAVRLAVAESKDALSTLAIPDYWKSAIRSALPAGITVVQASLVTGDGVRATLRVPSDEVGWSLIEGVDQSTAFSKVTAPAPRREVNAWMVDFTFYFPPSR